MAKRASRDELTFYLKSPIEISHYALFGDNLQGHRKILVTIKDPLPKKGYEDPNLIQN